MDLVILLRVAHILLFISVCIFIYAAYRISKFKNSESNLLFYILIGIFILLILGLIIHRVCQVKTKLGYYLGLHDYPKYLIY